MIVLGITGSMGTGKTTVANMFQDRGILTHSADDFVHSIYQHNAEALRDIIPAAIDSDGKVNTHLLRDLIVQNPEIVRRIEDIVHPLVKASQQEFLDKCRKSGDRIAVLDVPLLFESNTDTEVDKVLVTTTTPENQRQRVMQRQGMNGELFEILLALQMPDTEKREKAHYVIDTGQTLDDMEADVSKIISDLENPQRDEEPTKQLGTRPPILTKVIKSRRVKFDKSYTRDDGSPIIMFYMGCLGIGTIRMTEEQKWSADILQIRGNPVFDTMEEAMEEIRWVANTYGYIRDVHTKGDFNIADRDGDKQTIKEPASEPALHKVFLGLAAIIYLLGSFIGIVGDSSGHSGIFAFSVQEIFSGSALIFLAAGGSIYLYRKLAHKPIKQQEQS